MLNIFTLALDAMPYITWHLPVLNKLRIPWTWTIVEGVAQPVRDTRWVNQIPLRISADGTHEFLMELSARHPRVRHIYKQGWDGKTEMCNVALAQFNKPGVLLQLDADEIWERWQLEAIYHALTTGSQNCAYFYCRYFLGENILATARPGYGNNPGEWLRAWRFNPEMRFDSHEPPKIAGFDEVPFTREETEKMGLVFDHYSWHSRAQVNFKAGYYPYPNALRCWELLQSNKQWPVKLRDWLPWTDEKASADLLIK